MIKRLRAKFVCINMAIVTVMLMVIFGLMLNTTWKNMEAESVRMLQMVSEMPPKRDRDGFHEEKVRLPYLLVQVMPQGDIRVMSSGLSDLEDEASVAELIALVRQQPQQTGILEEYNLRYRWDVMPFEEKFSFVDISREGAAIMGLLRSTLPIGCISFAVFFVISVLLARWAVRPVETAWNQQRQFVADASHELKTPLTVIMTNAELLQSPQYGSRERMQFVDSILIMSRQMRGLVESLLEQARVDNGMAETATAELEFSELISDGLLTFEPVYFEQALLLESQIEEGIRVKGSAARLQQVLDILLDNAAKYSASGGLVTVTLKQQSSHCLLSVSNPGEQISREDLKNIFKRFYRADKARSMNHSYGLGLSIAEGIVKAHGGRIWAESREGINTFFVQLTAL